MTALAAYRARWVLPISEPPLEHGCVIVARGRIVSVSRSAPPASVPLHDLGDVALIPGLVNCHTHLEFSELTAPFDTRQPFTSWVSEVIAYRRSHPDVTSAAIRRGLEESRAAGVTLLGDIATTGWSDADYSGRLDPQAVVFQELLGLSDERIADQLSVLRKLDTTDATTRGYSPHAPYSTHPQLFGTAVEAAQQTSALVAVHLAESPAERELLTHARGEFREFLESLGLWREGLFGGRTFTDWLEKLAQLPRALVIHGNDLNITELGILSRSPHVALIYCPRTHAAFGHAPHPWRDLIAMGGSVAIGTDSRASNPDLSLWKELQFLAEQSADIPQHSILRLGTLAGAQALGRGSDCGSLAAGKRADMAVIRLAEPSLNPVYQILAAGNVVANTMLAGEWVTSATA